MTESKKQKYLDILNDSLREKINKYLKTMEDDMNSKKSKKTDDLIDHTIRVINICQRFIDKLKEKGEVDFDEETLIIAACFHDIAKCDPDETDEKGDRHNKKEKVKKEIKRLNLDSNLSEVVRENVIEIIKYHRGHKKDYHPQLYKQASILRMADKLDKFNKEKGDGDKKCKNSMKIIMNYLNEQDLNELFRELKKIKFSLNFSEVYNELKTEIKSVN